MTIETILDFIRQHGDFVYAMLLLHATSNSGIIPLIAGYAAHAGILDYATLVAVLWVGGFVGDELRFWAARRWGPALLRRFPSWRPRVELAAKVIHLHFYWFIFSHRFAHGVRNVTGFAYGFTEIPRLRFTVCNFAAAGLWAFAFTGAGYAFGHLAEATLGRYAGQIGLALLAAFAAVSYVLFRRVQRAVAVS